MSLFMLRRYAKALNCIFKCWKALFDNYRHTELVSVPHRTGKPHAVNLANGVLKQVQHDSQ
jgi:hypothetical protein